MKRTPRYMVWIGGGISELHTIRSTSGIKTALRAWVAGQKRCPLDCEITAGNVNDVRRIEDWIYDNQGEAYRILSCQDVYHVDHLLRPRRNQYEGWELEDGDGNPFLTVSPFSRG